MKKLKLLGILIFVAIISTDRLCAQKTVSVAESDRLVWWQDAKFGMFLHWGLYSQAAGDWKGRPFKGSEHFMMHERISLKDYATLAQDFNPTLFNAETWVKRAKNAGMKYVVITAKHHEGFAMYNSPSSDYNIVKKTPWKRDPIKELAAACKKHGLKLGIYYSLGRDWEDPDVPTNWPTKGGRSNLVDFPDEDAKDFSKYFERKVKPQIRELLTQYGPVGVMWFDTPELISKAQSIELKELIRSLQPNCIINNRIGNGLGDYQTSEQQISANRQNNPWEACITMSGQWSYNKYDKAWKSPELIVRQLVEIVSKGGNLLLNINPKGDGEFPEQSVERLEAIGKWMNINKEAIYGVTPWAVTSENVSSQTVGGEIKKDTDNDATSKVIKPDLYYTARGKEIFLFARSWKDAQILAKSLKPDKYLIKKVVLLGSKSKILWKQDKEGLLITAPEKLPGDIPVYTYRLTI